MPYNSLSPSIAAIISWILKGNECLKRPLCRPRPLRMMLLLGPQTPAPTWHHKNQNYRDSGEGKRTGGKARSPKYPVDLPPHLAPCFWSSWCDGFPSRRFRPWLCVYVCVCSDSRPTRRGAPLREEEEEEEGEGCFDVGDVNESFTWESDLL